MSLTMGGEGLRARAIASPELPWWSIVVFCARL